MVTLAQPPDAAAVPVVNPLPLENGDRMRSGEFLRRYEAMPEVKKAELIAEIAASTASLDLQEKLCVYRRCGVNEYLVWRTTENQFDWFVLENEEYRRQLPGGDGLLRSQVFAGLVLEVAALLARDGGRVLAALDA